MNKKDIQKNIQQLLNRGYAWFHKEKYEQFVKFASMNIEFYNSELRGKISYPPYQLATQLMANYSLMPWMALSGLSMSTVFPGDYEKSKEFPSEDGSYEIRSFTSELFQNGEFVGKITFLFYHSHNEFKFIKEPKVLLE